MTTFRIDSLPALGGLLRDILGLIDLAVVPIGPSLLDIWSSIVFV